MLFNYSLSVMVRVLFLFVLHLLLITRCESYSTTESFIELLAKEDVILQGVEEFQQKRIKELQNLQRKIEFIDEEHSKSVDDVQGYLSNPIDAYKMIKRLIIDWNEMHAFIKNRNAVNDFSTTWTLNMEDVKLPNESDFYDAIQDLTRHGNEIDGESARNHLISGMSWDECYEIGIRLYDGNNLIGALTWLQEALEKMKDTPEFNTVLMMDIVEYIAYSHYMLGNVEEATTTLDQVIDIPAEHSTVAEARAYFLLNMNNFLQKLS